MNDLAMHAAGAPCHADSETLPGQQHPAPAQDDGRAARPCSSPPQRVPEAHGLQTPAASPARTSSHALATPSNATVLGTVSVFQKEKNSLTPPVALLSPASGSTPVLQLPDGESVPLTEWVLKSFKKCPRFVVCRHSPHSRIRAVDMPRGVLLHLLPRNALKLCATIRPRAVCGVGCSVCGVGCSVCGVGCSVCGVGCVVCGGFCAHLQLHRT